MTVKSTEEFRSYVLDQLSFAAFPKENYILYQNVSKPEMGYFHLYSRAGYYDFGIADYTIPHNFRIVFDNPNKIVRFGNVFKGTTNFRLEKQTISSFTPSTFFVVERDLKGEQVWRQGQHFHGIEITIYEKYLKEVIDPYFTGEIKLDEILQNHTYRFLPMKIVEVLQQLQGLSDSEQLTPLYLESKIMECMAVLANEMRMSNNYAKQMFRGEVTVGKNRKITLTAADVQAIQQAHSILTEQYRNPPTIDSLSKIVLLNPQKLKTGFRYYNHSSIGEYTNNLRMTAAVNLLSTTNLSIEEVAHKVGYQHCSNFINHFKKRYGKTPLSFRKSAI
jgi:AraC-like DNA-binding protein